ncbi:MAG TPA: tetratricopeptide repeat protein [Candidatus Cloacimonadota bacterium]|jgi:tetratricopeptide (TPR) repeat protein|nr:tetratricopeptide repeat protein [Candidatus Cloacimonadota bacterium]HOF59820.1 tetratricopeptide repeat protein [Candidatus Cloacimonadota bacterium]HOR58681.1 tetratricopeptide repeat protein [Candidatus Cloacimonadota bacterium]HPB09136.1 tetratricopeptide repeat protein [Candidatus Cloacimonadota bacterium]HQL13446.1 tetratricopeptide repeat protein [Candidatus Cloacimonadota bacterium]
MNSKACLLLLFAAFLLLVSSPAWGQYNEREILTQQALAQLGVRQFAEAEKIFLQILEKYPNDTNSVLQLMNVYFQTSQLDKAEELLKRYRRSLPENQGTEQEIQLLIMRGKPEQAWNLSQAYLQRQNYGEGNYRLLASFFERRGFFDQVLRLYRDARKQLGKPDLFRLEIANSALNFRQFDVAVSEYLTWLEQNPPNLYFVNNQCKTIIKEDPSMLRVIGNHVRGRDSEVLRELYANILVSQQEYLQALEIYKQLPLDKLIRFANEQFTAQNDRIALPAFEYLGSLDGDAFDRNEYKLRQAQIQFRNGNYGSSTQILLQISAEPQMRERQNLFRKGVNLATRKLLAETALATAKDIPAALDWYGEARQFCNNNYDLQDVDLAVVRLLIIQQDYDRARQKLLQVREPRHGETRDYLLFTLELMRGNTELADSLMNDYLIAHPAGAFANDAIYQMMLVLGLQEADKESFFGANRLMMLRDPAAIDSLQSVFLRNGDEELLILASEWAILLARQDKAKTLLEHEWQDEVCAEYAALLKLVLTTDGESEQLMARDFLKNNPDSIFAPKFRQSLSRMNYSRPDY